MFVLFVHHIPSSSRCEQPNDFRGRYVSGAALDEDELLCDMPIPIRQLDAAGAAPDSVFNMEAVPW
jgi:hypothetical protein